MLTDFYSKNLFTTSTETTKPIQSIYNFSNLNTYI